MNWVFRDNSDRRREKGFTLIEVCIVLMIISLIGVPMMMKYKADHILEMNLASKGNLSAIKTALEKYVYKNGVYPRPADRNVAIGGVNFGQPNLLNPAAIPSCTISNATICRSTKSAGNTVLIGTVPFAALGLPIQYAADKNGYKYTYAVTEALTTGTFNDAGGIVEVVHTSKATGASFITTPNAHYVLVWHGNDGKGAYTLGGAVNIPCPTATGSAGDDDTNCNNDYSFNDAAGYESDVAGVNHFDDSLVVETSVTNGLWTKQVSASAVDITNRNGGNISIGSKIKPLAKVDIYGNGGSDSGDLKADRMIINRLCDYSEACAAGTKNNALIGVGADYYPDVFRPDIIAGPSDDANVNAPGGGIGCSSGLGSGATAMTGIKNSDETCLTFPTTYNLGSGCDITKVPSGISGGQISCVASH